MFHPDELRDSRGRWTAKGLLEHGISIRSSGRVHNRPAQAVAYQGKVIGHVESAGNGVFTAHINRTGTPAQHHSPLPGQHTSIAAAAAHIAANHPAVARPGDKPKVPHTQQPSPGDVRRWATHQEGLRVFMNMPPDQRNAVYSYQGGYVSGPGSAGEVNGALRAGRQHPATPLIDAAINSARTSQPVTLYRGQDYSFGSGKRPDLKVGDVLPVGPGYTSASSARKVGYGFATAGETRRRKARGAHLYKIELPPGYPALPTGPSHPDRQVGIYHDEREVLLPRGIQFKVKAVSKPDKNNVRTVTLVPHDGGGQKQARAKPTDKERLIKEWLGGDSSGDAVLGGRLRQLAADAWHGKAVPNDEQGRAAKAIADAVKNESRPSSQPLYRGVAIPYTQLKDFSRDKQVGDTIELTPASWTADESVAKSFSTPGPKDAAVMFTLPKGTPSYKIAASGSEAEHVVAGQFRVTGKDYLPGGGIVLHLEASNVSR